MLQQKDLKSLDHTTFLKFRRLYLLAFLLIAITIVVAQILIQNHLNSQLNDSQIVNIAGRQRMLSQKLVKESLLLNNITDSERLKVEVANLKKELKVFDQTHADLQDDLNALSELNQENSKINKLFAEIETDQEVIVSSINDLLLSYGSGVQAKESEVQDNLNRLISVEGSFLVKMDAIVNEYDAISQQKVKDLKRKEYLLLIISIGILLLEILFLFRPISIYIKNVIRDLVHTEKELKIKVDKANELYVAKENSLQELQGLNYAINNTVLFANLKEDGTILHISKKFSKLIGYVKDQEGLTLDDLLQIENKDEMSVRDLIDMNQHAIWTGELEVSTRSHEKLWLEMSVVPMNQVKKNKSVLILCTDITKRIESQDEIVRLSEQKFKKEVSQQKAQASQIVEAQEEERKRIAKDIHDGIGQMLTALKFNIESINFEEKKSFEPKVNTLKELLSELIKEVRAVTFNLTPPELRDYGIVPTLNKLVDQLSQLTGKPIYFENKTDFNGRFDSLIETNLYRVVQEAVNNALKYAEASFILITLSHSSEKLSIVIDDNGKGFDQDSVTRRSGDSGLGLFFMKERISYIDGRIFINSNIGEGTRITINMDLKGKELPV